jgi:hypothetical protein
MLYLTGCGRVQPGPNSSFAFDQRAHWPERMKACLRTATGRRVRRTRKFVEKTEAPARFLALHI